MDYEKIYISYYMKVCLRRILEGRELAPTITAPYRHVEGSLHRSLA